MFFKNQYWYFKKAIPSNEIDIIINLCENNNLQQAKIDTKQIVNKKKRDCLISWCNDKKIYDIINPYIQNANKNAGWNFEISWNEDCQYTVYNKSQFYGYHIDSNVEPYTNNLNKNYNGKIRKLSMTLQLTDPSEYNGGDFYVKYFDSGKVKEHKIKDAKEKGTLIVFPSSLLHRVTPITKGTRKSLVCWTLGFPFK